MIARWRERRADRRRRWAKVEPVVRGLRPIGFRRSRSLRSAERYAASDAEASKRIRSTLRPNGMVTNVRPVVRPFDWATADEETSS